ALDLEQTGRTDLVELGADAVADAFEHGLSPRLGGEGSRVRGAVAATARGRMSYRVGDRASRLEPEAPRGRAAVRRRVPAAVAAAPRSASAVCWSPRERRPTLLHPEQAMPPPKPSSAALVLLTIAAGACSAPRPADPFAPRAVHELGRWTVARDGEALGSVVLLEIEDPDQPMRMYRAENAVGQWLG